MYGLEEPTRAQSSSPATSPSTQGPLQSSAGCVCHVILRVVQGARNTNVCLSHLPGPSQVQYKGPGTFLSVQCDGPSCTIAKSAFCQVKLVCQVLCDKHIPLCHAIYPMYAMYTMCS